MNVKCTYPSIKRGSGNRKRMLSVLRWPLIGIIIASGIVNICIGGPLWSVIVAFSIYMLWTLVLSPDLVEYNRTSQSIKVVFWSSILLALVDILFEIRFALFVIPIVCFGGMTVCIVLFFTNLETQKHNMLPLVNFIFVSMIGSSVALYFHHDAANDWPFIVLLGLSVIFLFALIVVLGQDFRREMKRRFHIK